MSIKAKGLTPEQQDIIRTARSVIRDMAYGILHDRDLAEPPVAVCDKLSALLGERYNFRTGDVLDSRSSKR
jgi:hypothetical protein